MFDINVKFMVARWATMLPEIVALTHFSRPFVAVFSNEYLHLDKISAHSSITTNRIKHINRDIFT